MKKLSKEDIKAFLDEKYLQYNCKKFIGDDPISIPHYFTKKEDIEIAGFLAATIAWGQRPTIIKNAKKLVGLMDDTPHDFILNAKLKELEKFKSFVHRTFNGVDSIQFIKSLQHIYKNHGGLQNAFFDPEKNNHNLYDSIVRFRNLFFSITHEGRSQKHVSNPEKNASAKRLCMYLRWMVRKDKQGVDFGLWSTKSISATILMCPLDVHTGNTARKLGLLTRVQSDWKAVVELTENLKKLDINDPVKYDFALFGLGIYEKF